MSSCDGRTLALHTALLRQLVKLVEAPCKNGQASRIGGEKLLLQLNGLALCGKRQKTMTVWVRDGLAQHGRHPAVQQCLILQHYTDHTGCRRLESRTHAPVQQREGARLPPLLRKRPPGPGRMAFVSGHGVCTSFGGPSCTIDVLETTQTFLHGRLDSFILHGSTRTITVEPGVSAEGPPCCRSRCRC